MFKDFLKKKKQGKRWDKNNQRHFFQFLELKNPSQIEKSKGPGSSTANEKVLPIMPQNTWLWDFSTLEKEDPEKFWI